MSKKGSSFRCQVVTATSLNEVRDGYKRISFDPVKLSAAHAIGCVNFYSRETGKTNSCWSDHGEWGAGKHVSDLLVHSNVKIFVFPLLRWTKFWQGDISCYSRSYGQCSERISRAS